MILITLFVGLPAYLMFDADYRKLGLKVLKLLERCIFLCGICMLADVNIDHGMLAIHLSFLYVLGNTPPCKIISEIITFSRENPVALTKMP